MADSEYDFAGLIQRFHGLSRPDRKAILATFSADERLVFENAVATEERITAEEQARQRRADRQYLGYSHSLAEIVEICTKGGHAGLAPAAAKAVADEHARLIASEPSSPRDGWRGILDRVEALLSPPPKGLP